MYLGHTQIICDRCEGSTRGFEAIEEDPLYHLSYAQSVQTQLSGPMTLVCHGSKLCI